MRTTVVSEGAKSAPPVMVTALAWFADLTINDVVGVVTILYVLAQTAYLIWKWRKEAI